jgi:hypothetical protein
MKKRISMAAGAAKNVLRIRVHVLESDRFEVLISGGQRESAAKFASKPAELLSLDVWTPDVEGWEPTENQPRHRIIPPLNLKKSLEAPPNGAQE